MRQYTAVSRSVSRDAVFALHKAGCADLVRRERREYGGTFTRIAAPNVEAALDEYIDEELREMGYSTADVKVFDCTADADEE